MVSLIWLSLYTFLSRSIFFVFLKRTERSQVAEYRLEVNCMCLYSARRRQDKAKQSWLHDPVDVRFNPSFFTLNHTSVFPGPQPRPRYYYTPGQLVRTAQIPIMPTTSWRSLRCAFFFRQRQIHMVVINPNISFTFRLFFFVELLQPVYPPLSVLTMYKRYKEQPIFSLRPSSEP